MAAVTPNTPAVIVGWLDPPRFDLLLIFGILAVALAAAGVSLAIPALFIPLMLADLWLLGYHHLIATFTKLAATKADRQRHAWLIWALLPAMLIFTLTLGYMQGVMLVVTVYFFWQWFHYVRQSWGIAQRYRRAAGGLSWDNARLSELTLWSVPVWGVLNRCSQQPGEFLFLPVWMPPVPDWMVDVAGLLTLALLANWALTRWQAWRAGQLAMGHTLYMVSHFIVFAVGYVAIADVNVGWLLVNIWHNSQYLLFVWLYNRQRFATGVSAEAPRLSWLVQPGAVRMLLYFAAGTAIAAAIYIPLVMIGPLYQINAATAAGGAAAATSMAIIVSMAMNFHHYVVDGIIWKRKRDAASPSV